MKYDPFMYGKNEIEGIVGIEYQDGKAIIFKESKYGETQREEINHELYSVYSGRVFADCQSLDGNLELQQVKKFRSSNDQQQSRRRAYSKGYAVWSPRTETEGILIGKGLTFFKGLDPEDVSVLALDLETVNIDPTLSDSKILIIRATYRKGDYYERKEFAYDQYINESLMVADFCDFVRRVDPALIIGYNILGFDFPYMDRRGHRLRIARNRSTAKFSDKTAEKRKDQSQSYTFTPVSVWGRQVVDLLHLAIEWDLANSRVLPSYKLKDIMSHQKLEKSDRTHYDASKIKQNYMDPVEWEKIKAYCLDDADDCIRLLDHMWPAFFHLTQHIPMTFERMTQTSSGNKINNFMIREYFRNGHSIPRGDKKEWYPGGISIGNPGRYEHIYKVDVASMYPSIIIKDNVCVDHKDPLRVYPKMVDIFTTERLKNKAFFQKTKLPSYNALQSAQKIFINSCYGYLGAPHLNFNSMEKADEVTAEGRVILERGIAWAKSKGFSIVNADTDSFSFTSGKKLDNFPNLIKELNLLYEDQITWEDDGYYPIGLVIAAKNYLFVRQDGSWLMKGNSLKATMKEPALKTLIKDYLTLLLRGDINGCINRYNTAIVSASNITTVSEMEAWCSRKTVTKSVLTESTEAQARINEAIQGKGYSEADKIQTFFETDKKVSLLEDFNGVYERKRLYEKIYKTTKILDSVLDLSLFPNYKLKRNQTGLEVLCCAAQIVRKNSDIDNTTI